MKEIKGKLEIKINPKLKAHMEKMGDKNQGLLNAIEAVRSDGFNLVIDNNLLENDNRLSINEAINKLVKIFIQMKNIVDRVVIEDTWYTKAFGDEVENALITMAVIKAFGIGKNLNII
ncbi:hypothetical protein [Veillonella sp. 3627]|uniref:hypothetical protein n=1 Tax=Veillonella sp. 3627 TaxID=2490953 RepID=UPI000F8C33C3|nr:hypothetical protein [Veillonella sp. 3627]